MIHKYKFFIFLPYIGLDLNMANNRLSLAKTMMSCFANLSITSPKLKHGSFTEVAFYLIRGANILKRNAFFLSFTNISFLATISEKFTGTGSTRKSMICAATNLLFGTNCRNGF